MKIISTILFLLVYASNISCKTPKQSSVQVIDTTKMQTIINDDEYIAFPGAEGFGKYTTGGRGGIIYKVTNLNDAGDGSFRQAAEAKESRIIVFDVSGTIHLESRLNIKGNVTIAGQTAPGDGICIADQPVVLAGDNIIVRYLRFRMGDKYQNAGMVHGSGSDDAFGGTKKKNIIIDHCSMSWSTDEAFSVYGGDSTTLQWNIIAEPLNYSYHFEKGDTDFEKHGYGAIWGGKHLTAHHNLFAHCNSRTPRFDGIRNVGEENVDLCNNVIYNWGGNNIYAGEGGNYNIVNNYFKYGPNTSKGVRYRIANPWSKLPEIPYGKWYVNGNYVDGAHDVTKNNWLGVTLEKGKENSLSVALTEKPFPAILINMQNPLDACGAVLKRAGASLPRRDTLDERIVNDVKNRTGKIIDVQGGFPHGTVYALTINAWPSLLSKAALKDTDKDGMPDDWELAQGLNPNDASDASQKKIHRHYTNIEVYINSLVKY